ncbi:gluconate 2-dehydrogenase subunit 3 family protein [Thioclava sp. FTW29]|uniref:Gluconate 2-dehydrogenase subunit 3 family protein n=1 Tax=Thioclava litoralis TaxID=3076557 RepID=A0ABZ1E6X8_9RHOB|nr:gluconate 2-dehydrogenase subunit 3 family protein [Thioclava sp. FTW29]
MPSSSFAATRRGFLKAGAAGFALSQVTNPAAAQTKDAPPLDQYEPVYLTAAEWSFLMAACARLIPGDEAAPGAIEARVPVFIDRQLAGEYGNADDWYMDGPHDAAADPLLGWQTPLTPAQVYRKAIPEFDTWCRAQFGASFVELSSADQDAALTALQNNKGDGTGGGRAEILPPELRDFFTILLSNTKEGFFADPMYGGNYKMAGWKHIGFPGARASYTEWVEMRDQPYPLGPVSIKGERG